MVNEVGGQKPIPHLTFRIPKFTWIPNVYHFYYDDAIKQLIDHLNLKK